MNQEKFEPYWVPVSEGLPDEKDRVVGLSYLGIHVMEFWGDGVWFYPEGGRVIENPTHWKKLINRTPKLFL